MKNMPKKINTFLFLVCILISRNIIAKTYEPPPSISTSSHVPYISDLAMEQCVKLYNEAKWLGNEINTMQVNNYNKVSVDNYNRQVNQHSSMINSFNENCAGKRSESAYKAAQKLNNKK